LSYKKINMTNDDFYSKLLEISKSSNMSVEAENKPNNLIVYQIIIPGEKNATVNVYDTKKGLTINPCVGKNQEFSKKIVESILEDAESVTTETKNIEGVHQELFKEFCDYFSEFIKDKNEKDFETFLKLEDKNKASLTIHWYYKNKKMMLQGRKTPFWKQIEYWIVDKTSTSADEVINILIKSEKDFDKFSTEYSDSFVSDKISNLVPRAFNDKNILVENEKKWLKTCYFLTKSKIILDDYLCTVFGAINTIEGILRRLLIHHFNFEAFDSNSKNFICFNNGSFKNEFANNLSNECVNIMEELYDFYRKTRNNYFHNSGLNQYIISDKQNAVELFEKVINLINKVADNKNEVFRKLR